ncbi:MULTISPECIES: LuxR C-terminal-related transcriptional regulator [Amycolatopsis]|uniref:LuxR C-terminal-related transcriptional regulator n=1 Tax=Amycolatopsis TaxID=1813 RepID=UPI00106EFBF2|nr:MULTISPECIES: LuxR C-terminal-related transcriptional regulator [Amycolatopsis]
MSQRGPDERTARLVVSATDELSAATSTEELLEVYLRVARSALPTRSFGIYLFSSARHRSATEGVSDLFLARYEDAGREQDPVLRRAVDTRSAAHSAHLMPPDDWQDLPFYQDVLALHGMRMVLEAPIVAGGRILGTLNFADQDPGLLAGEAEVAVASALGRVVGSAVASLEARDDLRRERDNAWAALDLAAVALVTTDLRTGKRRLNEAARQLLREVSDEDPESWLEETMAARNPRDGFAWTVPLAERGLRLSLRSRPVPDDEVAVAVLRLERDAAGLPPSIAARLTPREREIAVLAVEGLSDDQIAARVLLSPYTVKQHLKAVYRKLGIGSRQALTRVVLSAPPSFEG